MADRSAEPPVHKKQPSVYLVEEVTFRGETGPIPPLEPLQIASGEANSGKRFEPTDEHPLIGSPDNDAFLLGLHAIDPILGDATEPVEAMQRPDSLLGISPPLEPGSHTNVPIAIWYRNPFPCSPDDDDDDDEPEPNWTPIRPYPRSDDSHNLSGGETTFFGGMGNDKITVAATLSHVPAPKEDVRSGAILDTKGEPISDTDTLTVTIGDNFVRPGPATTD